MTQSKVYPASDHVKFLLCEDLRREENGKLIAIGLYPGEQVVIHKSAPVAGIPSVSGIQSLCFVFIASKGEGKFASRLVIEGPDGKQVFDQPTGPVDLDNNVHATMSATLRPFPVRAFGQHRAVLYLDDTAYSFTCGITMAEASTTGAPTIHKRRRARKAAAAH